MQEHQHHRTPSTQSLARRMIRLLEREVCQLEAHYDALEAAPPVAATQFPPPRTRRRR